MSIGNTYSVRRNRGDSLQVNTWASQISLKYDCSFYEGPEYRAISSLVKPRPDNFRSQWSRVFTKATSYYIKVLSIVRNTGDLCSQVSVFLFAKMMTYPKPLDRFQCTYTTDIWPSQISPSASMELVGYLDLNSQSSRKRVRLWRFNLKLRMQGSFENWSMWLSKKRASYYQPSKDPPKAS